MMAVQERHDVVPWKSVYTGIGLLLAGLAMFIAGLVLWQTEGNHALIGLWVLGMLVFIPGAYVTRLSYKVWKGHRGYSWSDLPDVPSLQAD